MAAHWGKSPCNSFASIPLPYVEQQMAARNWQFRGQDDEQQKKQHFSNDTRRNRFLKGLVRRFRSFDDTATQLPGRTLAAIHHATVSYESVVRPSIDSCQFRRWHFKKGTVRCPTENENADSPKTKSNENGTPATEPFDLPGVLARNRDASFQSLLRYKALLADLEAPCETVRIVESN
jgi:hypothetical protein